MKAATRLNTILGLITLLILVFSFIAAQGMVIQSDEPAVSTGFPTVDDTVTTGCSSTSTGVCDVSLPATVDSNELLVIIAYSESDTFNSVDSGFSVLASYEDPSYGSLVVCGKSANGTEDGTTVAVEFGQPLTAVAIVYRTSGWGGNLSNDVDLSSSSNVSSAGNYATPDPAPVTAGWGSDKNLFIAYAGAYDDEADFTEAPTNYSNLVDVISGGGLDNGAAVGAATREYESSSDDPDAFSLDREDVWQAATLVIKPGTDG